MMICFSPIVLKAAWNDVDVGTGDRRIGNINDEA